MTTEITPQTKVGELLKDSRIEQALLDYHPAFAKLKNPILRRTVARVATLRQAAEVAGVDVGELVATLRLSAGQSPVPSPPRTVPGEDQEAAPAWTAAGEAVARIDVDQALERGEHPLPEVLRLAGTLVGSQRIELVASFKPVPLIDTVAQQNLRVACVVEPDGRFRVHVSAQAV
ncbi:MAG: DUF1858 domain-containing protein [Pseudomonadota bacterium]